MKNDIQARGFTLSSALFSATIRQIDDYRSKFPRLQPTFLVRLVDINGGKGGVDKACLVSVRLSGHNEIVTKERDSNMYRAIGLAFSKLVRATHSALSKEKAGIRRIRGKTEREFSA